MATSNSEFTTDELHHSLVKWLENCLALGGTLVFNPSSVSDGVAISDALVQLAPDFFTPNWRGKIISETGGKWKLKLNNLKKIQRGVLDYYDQVLHLSLEKLTLPNLEKIAEHESKVDTARLLQLVLGIAINCDRKDTYIQAIMSMQQEVQHVVMGAIQELMNYEAPSMVAGEDYKELEEEHKRNLAELRAIQIEKEQLLQRSHDLQLQLKASREEVEDVTMEMELLKTKLKEAQSAAGMSAESKSFQLQRQLDTVKSEKLRVETERDEQKYRLEELHTQNQELLQKNRDLQLENEEMPFLRDSLEEMKYLESKVKNYESVISQYKKKLEDALDLRRQLKALEDKNMIYMQQNLDLEEELRRLSGLRDKVELQRGKIQELENELAQEKLRCLEASQDGEDKTQAVESLRSELAQVKQERDMLSMQIPGTPTAGGAFAMFSSHSQHSHHAHHPPLDSPSDVPASPSVDHPDLGGGGLGWAEVFTPELRAKIVRLEKENEILKRRLEREDDTESPIVGPAGDDGLRTKVAEQLLTIERLEREVEDRNRRLSRLEVASNNESQLSSLKEAMKLKEAEIEKYKKYLNKAKKIIEGFGEGKSRAAEDSLEIQTLRNQMKEKEKTIERLEREYSQDRLAWEREEKLVVSAWYEMGLMMHRKYSQERLTSQHNTPFLVQQRQSLYKRPVPLNTSLNISPALNVGDSSHS